MSVDNKYIQRCFDLARFGISTTSPNPSVGAVIVDNQNRIIGEGWTSPYGGAHAEVNAVNSVKLENQFLLKSSTIYVSLEPCAHFGRTPPCVDLILSQKIPHVVIAYIDPFPKVAGKSIEKLQQNGVITDIVLHQDLNNKNATLLPFFTNISAKRPYIILKWAETVDGFIGHSEKTLSISNVYTKRLVHKWRSEADAIMVGTHTAMLDNPELTNRLYFGKSPIRVVLDKNRRLSPNLNIFDNSVKTIIYTEGGHIENEIEGENNSIYRPIVFDDDVIPTVLDDLQRQNIGILFVEGGAQLLNSFIQKGLWDEARVFKAAIPLMLEGGIEAPKIPYRYLERKLQLFDNQLFIFRNV